MFLPYQMLLFTYLLIFLSGGAITQQQQHHLHFYLSFLGLLVLGESSFSHIWIIPCARNAIVVFVSLSSQVYAGRYHVLVSHSTFVLILLTTPPIGPVSFFANYFKLPVLDLHWICTLVFKNQLISLCIFYCIALSVLISATHFFDMSSLDFPTFHMRTSWLYLSFNKFHRTLQLQELQVHFLYFGNMFLCPVSFSCLIEIDLTLQSYVGFFYRSTSFSWLPMLISLNFRLN